MVLLYYESFKKGNEKEGRQPMFKKISKILPLLLTGIALLSNLAIANPKNAVDLDIYGINDFRGALRQEHSYPGAAKLGGAINNLRAENPLGTVLLGGGNMVFGTVESDDRNGIPVVKAMNIMEFDANVVGSHFFDFKPDIFKEHTDTAHFPYLACNIQTKDGDTLFKPSTMVTRKGVKIGVVGSTTASILQQANPAHLVNFVFLDQIKSTQDAIDEVKRQGADVVVLLLHCGVTQRVADQSLKGEAIDVLYQLKGVDICFTGDSQTLVNGRYNDIPVLQAGSHGEYIAKVHVVYDPDSKKILTKREEMLNVAGMQAPSDPQVASLVAPIVQAVDAKYGQVLAYNQRELTNNKFDQSPVAEYLTDLLRKDAKVDFVILNGGAFRSNMPEGKVTARNMEEIYPYPSQAVVYTMKGIDILAALDYGIDNQLVGQGRFSGIRLAVEPDLPPGEKIVDNVLPNGDRIDVNKEYTVLTNSYIAAGGDGYNMFKNGKLLRVASPDIKAYLNRLVEQAGSIDFREDNRFSVGELRN